MLLEMWYLSWKTGHGDRWQSERVLNSVVKNGQEDRGWL